MDAEREIRGLERNEITWFSNFTTISPGLKEDKITWYSNDSYITYPIDTGLEENKIAGDSNIKSINQEKSVWKGVKLHGFQTHATLSSQNTLGSGRNCRILKPRMKAVLLCNYYTIS